MPSHYINVSVTTFESLEAAAYNHGMAIDAISKLINVTTESGISSYDSVSNPGVPVRDGFVSKSWQSGQFTLIVDGVPTERYGNPPLDNFSEVFAAYLERYPPTIH